jgi:hypothetical protein
MTTCPCASPSPDGRPTADVRPSAPERARTVATRTTATVSAPGVRCCLPLAHAVTDAGQVLLVVPTHGDLAAAVRAAPGADLSTLVMVSDRAPVPLRRSVRAQLWLSGWATPVREQDRQAALLTFAEVNPTGALLDVGRTATLLRLDLAEVVLGEGGAGLDVSPQEFIAARPDPLAELEADTLRHLDQDHPEFLSILVGLLPEWAVGERDVVRPLGVDRYGFRLRIERPSGHYDVRLPFPRPLTCAGQLGPAVRHMTAAARGRTS